MCLPQSQEVSLYPCLAKVSEAKLVMKAPPEENEA